MPVNGDTARPLLRWAGSKRQLVPTLLRFWNPSFKRYVEPFAGSACLFFKLKPREAMLGDLNRDLIRTYIEVKYRAGKLLEALSAHRPTRAEYMRIRLLDPTLLDPTSRAARFIYLNRFCFNGLYRTNAKGQFNVPYSGAKSGNLPSESHLKECSRTLRAARLIAGDFEAILGKARRGDFVYMDPPFAVRAMRVFSEYGPASFSLSDLKRLRRCMEILESRGINFVVSYADSQEAELLCKGFKFETVDVRRNISGFANSRRRAKEILILNS